MGHTAFVIMPFASQFLGGYEDVIRPAVDDAGLLCVRADQQPQGHIPSQMLGGIFDATIVIADISDTNPNVFYELGVAHSLGSRTLTVAREDFVGDVPFDVAAYRVLVYPRVPDDGALEEEWDRYRMRALEARARLSDEIELCLRDPLGGVENPVQDYVAGRSPLSSAESTHLPGFSGSLEEEMLRGTERELVHVSLTAASFIGLLAAHVEESSRSTELKVTILLLDPDDRDAWRYVFLLRDGCSPTDDELELFLEENRAVQARTRSMMQRLTGTAGFTGEVRLYRGIPSFWGHAIDRRRLVVGHLALRRLGSRNLPVHVIVGDDPKTAPVFDYYLSSIDSLTGSTRAESA